MGRCTSLTPPPLAPHSIQTSPQHEMGRSRNSPLVIHLFLTSSLPPPFLSLAPSLPNNPPPSLSDTVAHEHLKDRGLFGLPPPPPGANPAEYYHLMTSHRSPYGELLMQGAGATAGAHLSDYITPIEGE